FEENVGNLSFKDGLKLETRLARELEELFHCRKLVDRALRRSSALGHPRTLPRKAGYHAGLVASGRQVRWLRKERRPCGVLAGRFDRAIHGATHRAWAIHGPLRQHPTRTPHRHIGRAALLRTLGRIAKAKGMTRVAREAGLGRESLYKTLAPGAKPRFDTIQRILAALGLRLSVEADKPRSAA